MFLRKFTTLLIYWGRATHICVTYLTTIASENGLSPSRRQAIIWTNDEILLIRPFGINFSEILIGNQTSCINPGLNGSVETEYTSTHYSGIKHAECFFFFKMVGFLEMETRCSSLQKTILLSWPATSLEKTSMEKSIEELGTQYGFCDMSVEVLSAKWPQSRKQDRW